MTYMLADTAIKEGAHPNALRDAIARRGLAARWLDGSPVDPHRVALGAKVLDDGRLTFFDRDTAGGFVWSIPQQFEVEEAAARRIVAAVARPPSVREPDIPQPKAGPFRAKGGKPETSPSPKVAKRQEQMDAALRALFAQGHSGADSNDNAAALRPRILKALRLKDSAPGFSEASIRRRIRALNAKSANPN